MSFDTIETILSSAVADAGTFTVGYPTGKDAGAYELGWDHAISTNGFGVWKAGAEVAFTFGTSNVTVTNNSGVTLPAGTVVVVQLDQPGNAGLPALSAPEKMAYQALVAVSLGAPDTADPDGISASASVSAAAAFVIGGALAAGGVATFDVPRNVVGAWTGTSVVTVTGTDEFGETLVESSASGTSLPGKKAFKTITGATSSGAITSATLGSGDVLGLPMFLSDLGRVTAQLQDGAAATAGTLVAGVRTEATATTGDVRGTYDPNSACNGSLMFNLLVALDNAADRGVAQYAG